jgi:uncharacterized protein YjbJ (UPF0337 family)
MGLAAYAPGRPGVSLRRFHVIPPGYGRYDLDAYRRTGWDMADRGEQLEGKAKEVGGKLTGNEELESEGRTQKAAEDTKEKVREGVDKVKGAVEGLKDAAR